MAGPLLVLVDGSPRIGRAGMAGVGVVVCTHAGQVLAWHYADAPATTSMEAEYQAMIAGLEIVCERFPAAPAHFLSDCRIVVEQLSGRCAVRAARLKPLHAHASALARQLVAVEFVTIPRDLNRMADALASFHAAPEQVAEWLDTQRGGSYGNIPTL